MQRTALSPKEELKRGAWTDKEDKLLYDHIEAHGIGRWRSLPAKAGLNRCGKSCRLRWLNYLRPGIKRGNITDEEEELIIRLHKLLGNRWSLIAGRIPGRTDNEIKNYWNTYLKKKISASSSSKITTTTVAATTATTTSTGSSLENPSPEEPNKSKKDNSISNKVEFKSPNNSFSHEEENLTLTLGFDSLLNFNGHQDFGPGSEFSYGELHGGSILTGYEWRGGKGSEEIQASFAEVEWESLIKSCEAV